MGEIFENKIQFFLNAHPGVTITQSGGTTVVAEGGVADTYTVVLTSIPTADVIITLDNTNNQVDGDATTLTFTAANWNIAQTVTITAANDSMGEGKHTGVIKHTVTSADAHYNGIAVNNVVVTVNDNDLPSNEPVFNAPSTNPFNLHDVGNDASPAFVDIDNDGDLDAFFGKANGTTVLFYNDGTALAPSFASAASDVGLTDIGFNSTPSFADIDGDGDLDAFVGGLDGNTVFFSNNGTAAAPSFASQSSNFGLVDVGSFAHPTFADIDGDGDLDAFVGNGDGKIAFFRNNGTAFAASFASESNNFGVGDVGSVASPSFADIDGDGDLDALVGNKDGNTVFFRNVGTASAPSFVSESGTFGLTDVGTNAKPTFVDVDSDGDLDALVGNSVGNTLFFLNSSTPNLQQLCRCRRHGQRRQPNRYQPG